MQNTYSIQYVVYSPAGIVQRSISDIVPYVYIINLRIAYGEIDTCTAYGEIDTCPAYGEIDTCPAYGEIDTCPA